MYYFGLCVNLKNRPVFTSLNCTYDMAALLQFAKPPVVSYSSFVVLALALTAMALSVQQQTFFPLKNLPYLCTHLQSHHDVINEKDSDWMGLARGINFALLCHVTPMFP